MTTIAEDFVLYYYVPNRAAAIFFAVAFLLGMAVYGFQVFHDAKVASKKLKSGTLDSDSGKDSGRDSGRDSVMVKSMDPELSRENILKYSLKNDKKLRVSSIACCFIPFFIGCEIEAIGYIARAISSSDNEALQPFIIQSVLLLVAPALYAATIYMIFGRLVRILRCEDLMLVSARFGTTFFVAGDVLSFLLQSSGGGLMAAEGKMKLGSNIVIAGLAVQVLFFGFFIINEIKFSLKVKHQCPLYWRISKEWFFLNLTLLISSVLIMIRSIVRLVEFIQGHDGFIMSHEVFIYVFDAVPMFLVVVTFCVGSYFGNIFRILTECQ